MDGNDGHLDLLTEREFRRQRKAPLQRGASRMERQPVGMPPNLASRNQAS